MNYLHLLTSILKSQISAIALTVSSLLVMVVLTRSTDVEVYGKYAIILGVVTLFSKFAGLNTFFHYRNRYPLVDYKNSLAILKSYFPFVLICGGGIAAFAAAINAFCLNFMPLRTPVDYALWFVLAMMTLLNFEIFRFYQSTGRYLFGVWTTVIAKIAFLILVCLFVLSSQEISIQLVILALIVGQIASLVSQLSLNREFLAIFEGRSSSFEWKSIIAGLMLIPSSLFNDGIFFFDRITVSNFLGFDTTGHYSLASQGVVILYSVMGGSIIIYFYPRLVVLKSKNEIAVLRRTILFIFSVGLATCAAGGLGINVFGELIPYIFGEKYYESIQIIRYMSFIPCFMFTLSVLSHMSYIYDRIKASAIVFAISIPINILLNIVLVQRLGFTGAIVATYVSLALAIAAQGFVVFRGAR